jgi:hypothetical protein
LENQNYPIAEGVNVIKIPGPVTDIKEGRMKWLGHVIRMDQMRMAKKLFDRKPGGRRKVRSQKLR